MSDIILYETHSLDHALTASVMHELHLPEYPPEDEYHDLPPAYNTFDVAFKHWSDADNAKQDIVGLNQDPALLAAETELKHANQALKQMQAMRSEIHSLNEIQLTIPSML